MKNTKNTRIVLRATLAVAALSVVMMSCGAPPPIHVEAPPADLTAVYEGNHSITATITSPQHGVMRPEQYRGPIHVYETAGGNIRMSLRLYEDGDTCHLRGQRSGSVVTFEPGQRCSIRFLYEGNVVIAGIEANSGNARFGGRRMVLDLTGPFVAEAHLQGRRVSLNGSGRITFSGNR